MDLEAFPEPRSSTVDSSSHNRNRPSRVDNETHLSKVRILQDKWAYQLPPKLEGAPHVIHWIWQSANPAAGEGHGSRRNEEAEANNSGMNYGEDSSANQTTVLQSERGQKVARVK